LESLQVRIASLEAAQALHQRNEQVAAEQLQEEKQARLAAERRVARLERLQKVTAALTAPLTPAQVAQVVVEQGIGGVEAKGGSVALLEESGQFLEIARATGYSPDALETWRRFPLDAPVPISDATRTRQVVLIESSEESHRRYPNLTGQLTSDSYAAIPLEVEGRSFGALGLTFNPGYRLDQDERNFLLALAGQCAQALERARLEEAEQVARRQTEINQSRLAFLAEAGEILNSSLDYQTTLTNLARLIVPRQADWCSVDMLAEDGSLQRLAVAHIDPTKVAWAIELHRRNPPDMNATTGIPNLIRTGQAEVYPVITDEMLVALSKNSEELEIARQVGFSSAMAVPLMARGRGLGAISFVWAESGHHYNQDDLRFAEDLAHRAALAVDNSRLYRESQDSLLVQQELDYLKNLFLSTATHELRTPLTAVKGYAQLLERALKKLQDDPALPDAQTFRKDLSRPVRSAEMIIWQVERMSRLVGELLDFSRLHNDKFELELADEVNLSDLVNRVVEQFSATGENHPLAITMPPQPILGYWDEARLEQVLINLISNAFKYSPEKSPVAVGLELRRGENLKGEAEEVVIRVQDSGIGIDEEQQPNIFARFYRVRSGNTAHVDGLGLGLYISHEIVARHGGRMWLESQPGKGSTFYFALPIKNPPEA
jgi:signal transduction histidine kinase